MTDTNVIVGAGQAGANAALAMRQAGFAGRILLIGDEAHHPYERPPLSKETLAAELEPEPTHAVAPSRLVEHGIELDLGTEVTGVDPVARRLSTARGQIPYDRLLLATGGRARRLAVPGGERALTMRTLDDARLIRGQLSAGMRVVCIGAGVIGLEIAASARKRGCTVTVLEAGTRVMARSLAPFFSTYMETLHRQAGVDIRFSVSVDAIGAAEVTAGAAAIPADCVIAGIGIERNTALATEAGAACDNGIVVDEFARTTVEGIFAAGDVAAFWHPRLRRRMRLEAWRHAQNHGIAAGRAMACLAQPYVDIPWFWTDQFGINLQVAGDPNEGRTAILRGDPASASFAAFYLDEESRVVAAAGINAPREVRAGIGLIEASTPVSPVELADPKVALPKLVAAAKKAA